MILAIETSSMVGSVAVGDVLLARPLGTGHDDLVGFIDQALRQAGVALGDLEALAVGAGPGSFTGLRIGMATAKGIAFAAGKPLWTASSLAALALDAAPSAPAGALLVPVVDARRGEVFAGFYRVHGELVVSVADERVVAAADLPAIAAGIAAGTPVAPGAITATPSARSIARLVLAGERRDELRAGTPVYLRQAAAETVFPAGNPGGPIPIGAKKQ
jgi:tRNA threonylcarbamoyladenosine biosynthesis protein TsaB